MPAAVLTAQKLQAGGSSGAADRHLLLTTSSPSAPGPGEGERQTPPKACGPRGPPELPTPEPCAEGLVNVFFKFFIFLMFPVRIRSRNPRNAP